MHTILSETEKNNPRDIDLKEIDRVWKNSIDESRKQIIFLDDDPTGAQTMGEGGRYTVDDVRII